MLVAGFFFALSFEEETLVEGFTFLLIGCGFSFADLGFFEWEADRFPEVGSFTGGDVVMLFLFAKSILRFFTPAIPFLFEALPEDAPDPAVLLRAGAGTLIAPPEVFFAVVDDDFFDILKSST
jgi:hypothetical protein